MIDCSSLLTCDETTVPCGSGSEEESRHEPCTEIGHSLAVMLAIIYIIYEFRQMLRYERAPRPALPALRGFVKEDSLKFVVSPTFKC